MNGHSSMTTIAFRKLARNGLFWARLSLGDRNNKSGSTHAERRFDTRHSIEYIKKLYHSYMDNGKMTEDELREKRLLEIGPGDSFGVALLFLAKGVNQVVAVDRFFTPRNGEQELATYAALRNELTDIERRRFDEAVSLETKPIFNTEKLTYLYDLPIENAADRLGLGSFDFVVSMAVLEHVYDLSSAFESMDKLLNEKGRMLHGVDLSDHEIFSKHGYNPLTLLTIPDWLYHLMSSYTGDPNREDVSRYRAKLSSLGYETRVLTGKVVGLNTEIVPHVERIENGVHYGDEQLAIVSSIRPKLLERYRNLSDEDLLQGAIFIDARKKGTERELSVAFRPKIVSGETALHGLL
jgi:SAM-dependent methyltransferase